MKHYLKAVAVLLMAGLFSTQAAAANVDITGKILAFPCEVDSESVSQIVDLGTVSSTGLSEPNSSHTGKDFSIKVINCPSSVTTLTATFTGTPAGAAGNLFANSGTAQNVAVQMVQQANNSIVQGNNSTMTVNVASDHTASFNLIGRPYSEEGNAVSGTLNSVVQVNFSYP